MTPGIEIQKSIFVSAVNVGLCARPTVVRCCGAESSPDWIPLDVCHCIPMMLITKRTGEIARLPDVAATGATDVEITSVISVRATQRTCERVRFGRNRHHVHVIWHQAIGRDSQAKALGVNAQQIQIELPALQSIEYDLTPVAALGDMMRDALEHSPRDPRHSSLMWIGLAGHLSKIGVCVYCPDFQTRSTATTSCIAIDGTRTSRYFPATL